MTKINILKTYLGTHKESELDFDIRDKMFPGVDWEDVEEFTENGSIRLDSHPIEIARLREILTQLESQGANWVEIDYHCDHIGYLLVGLSITPLSPEEAIPHIEKKKEESNKTILSHIEMLKQEIAYAKKLLK